MEAVSTGRFIGRPGPPYWRNAGPWAAVRPDRCVSRGATACARYVIHAVGPIYRRGQDGEGALLRSCYHESLWLAAEKKAQAIAFPCISTGVFRYPKAEACQIATDTVLAWLEDNEHPGRVVFCCFEPSDVTLYGDRILGQIPPK